MNALLTQAPGPMGSPQADSVNESSADVQQSTAALIEQHQRKKRSDAGKSRKVRESPQVQGPIIDPANAVNLELVKKSVASIVGAIDGLACRSLAGKSRRLGLPEPETTALVDAAALTRGEQEIISESTALICQRYDFIMRHAPEAMLACVMAAWGVRIVTVSRKLDAIEHLLKERQKKQQKEATGELSSQRD